MNRFFVCISLFAASALISLAAGCGNQPAGNGTQELEADPRSNGEMSGTRTDGKTKIDIRIAKFDVPDGWAPFSSDGNTRVGLMPADANPENVKRMVTIEVGIGKTDTVEESANSFTGQFNGTVDEDEWSLDGQRALMSEMPGAGGQVTPRQCLTLHRGKELIYIIYASDGELPGDVLKQLADSWTWNEPATGNSNDSE